MLSHPPSGWVHCVVRVSLDARPLVSPPALGWCRPRGFLDLTVTFDYPAPYFRASRPYISIPIAFQDTVSLNPYWLELTTILKISTQCFQVE